MKRVVTRGAAKGDNTVQLVIGLGLHSSRWVVVGFVERGLFIALELSALEPWFIRLAKGSVWKVTD